MAPFHAKIGWEMLRKRKNKICREREEIKIAFPFRSYPTGNKKFQQKKEEK